MLKRDFMRTYDLVRPGRTALGAWVECVRSPGVQAAAVYRFSQWVSRRNGALRILLMPLRVGLSDWIRMNWGIEIARTARIGEGLYIGHFGGIIIGESVAIGKDCNLSQGVTIGIAGKGENRGAPVIGDRVYIGPGAKLFGKIRIGDDVSIGANAVIHKDIPDCAVVALVPGFEILHHQAPGG